MSSQLPSSVSTDKLDLILDKLTAIERRLDILEHVNELPGLVATAGDVFDELAQTLEAEGLSPLSLISDLLPLLRTLLQPESLSALHHFLLALPEMTPVVLSARQLPGIAATAMDTVDELYERLVQSDERVQALLMQIQHLQSQVSPDEAIKTASGMMQTLQEGRQKAPALGPLGLLKALSDPDLQRLLGYLVYVSRQMSKDILKN